MRLLTLLLFFSGLGQQLQAQVFGGNPARLKFYQLNSDTVRIIFPKELEPQAREVAGLTHLLARQSPASLGHKLMKYDVVLQNQTTLSNAYVGLAPRRSEFFMMPDLTNLELTSLPWHHTLTVHEFRHIEQFSNFNRGFQRLMGIFLGQEGQAVAMGAAVPDWFWEGDAVWQETVSTPQGRGRLPHFYNGYRSLWMDKRNYSFQKLRNGSLRHYVPSHYDLGYLLVTHARQVYGDTIWSRITSDALDLKGLIYPFQRAVRRHTGLSYKQFVQSTFDSYRLKMQADSAARQVPAPLTAAQKNNVQFYQYPFVEPQGSLLVLKTAYRQVPAWFRIDTAGNETLLRVKDITSEQYYSYRNGTVVYTAYRPHPRWGWKDFSEIRIWDLQSDVVRTLTRNTRLFMPDLSPDGSQVVAVHSGTDMQSALHLVPTDGAAVRVLPNPDSLLFTYPRFSSDGNSVISAVRNNKGEMALLRTDLSTAASTVLLPFANRPLAYVQVMGDSVLFTAPRNGTDVLYLMRVSTGELFLAAELPNGNYQAAFDANRHQLVFTSWSSDGYLLQRRTLAAGSLQQVEAPTALPDLYVPAGKVQAYDNLLREVPVSTAPLTRYNPAFRLFNLHSWRPFLEEPDYGIDFFSENILNTLVAQYGYNYNRNEQSHQVSATMLYGGLFPVLSLGGSQTWHRSARLTPDTLITWNQSNVNVGVSLPFNFTHGTSFKNLLLQGSLHFDQLQFTGLAKNLIPNEDFRYYNLNLRWIQQSQRARQQIFPNWAQVYRVQYRQTFDGPTGNQFFANAGWYMPGLFRNHHLLLFASVQSRDTIRGGRFSNSFPFARGYNVINFPRNWRLSANYHLPLLYPDAGFAQLVYLLRVRSNLFYDYTQSRSLRTGITYLFRSAGAELYTDMRFWNNFPFTLGVRYSRLLDRDLVTGQRGGNRFEVILPLELF